VATAGRASEFFSGAELNAVVVSAGVNANPVNIVKDIGTTLQVTPTFLDDGRINLKVLAQRTFIKTPNNNLSGFDARVETSKSRVDASVVMRPGETLILGGLSEKEGEITRDGVPLLQDLPLVQYLFANRTSRDYQKSTLILITPRPAQYVYQPEKARQAYEKSLSEEERPFASLRARYADWFRPYPNWASVFRQLQENSLYREFRTGDVALENWTDMRAWAKFATFCIIEQAAFHELKNFDDWQQRAACTVAGPGPKRWAAQKPCQRYAGLPFLRLAL
jgi:hypothetical protein